MNNEQIKIESVAFTMWLSKYKSIKGNNGEWLTYWEHYDEWLIHEERDVYINHVKQSIKNWNNKYAATN